MNGVLPSYRQGQRRDRRGARLGVSAAAKNKVPSNRPMPDRERRSAWNNKTNLGMEDPDEESWSFA